MREVLLIRLKCAPKEQNNKKSDPVTDEDAHCLASINILQLEV